jgi:glycosyltransferase involved in cell wall biosynthesis
MRDREPPASTGYARTDLEVRLAELERRLRLDGGAPTDWGGWRAETEAELKVLREAVDDLAADTLDLHNQVAALLSSCERIVAGGGGSVVFDRGPGNRRVFQILRRVGSRAARGAMGAARRVLGSAATGPVQRTELEISLGAVHSGPAPSLAVVVPVTGDVAELDLPSWINEQTVSDFEIALWNEEDRSAVIHRPGGVREVIDSANRRGLADALSAEYVTVLPGGGEVAATTLELCKWTLVCEGLPLVLAVPDGGGRHRQICEVEHRTGLRDASAVADGAKTTKGLVAKVVGPGETEFAVGLPLVFNELPTSRVGRYLLSPTATGVVRHTVRSLTGVATAPPAGDDRRGVMLVASLADGADGMLAWLIREFDDEFRFTVVVVEPCEVNGVARLRAIAEIAPSIYPVFGFLDPLVWPSVITDLIGANGIETVVRIGIDLGLPSDLPEGVRVVDLPLRPSHAASTTDVDFVIAVGAESAAAARTAGKTVVEQGLRPSLPASPPSPQWLSTVRESLGAAANGRMVVMACDLTPDQRPEDFVAVAHRLHDRTDLHFRLVGEGPLAGTVSDLARYYGLERFALVPPGTALIDLAAAADIVVSTAEQSPWPVMQTYAVACGRALVAADVDGVRELVSDAAGDRCTLVSSGDLAGLAAAVIAAADSSRTPRATKKAWKAGTVRAAAGRTVLRSALRGNVDIEKGDR